MTEAISHIVEVHDKPGFLNRLMLELAGNTCLSLEGNLSHCRFSDDMVLTSDETTLLKRNTIAPKQDFVVLRLPSANVSPIFKQIMAAGLSRAVIHVHIERNRILELAAYDNFQHVATGPGILFSLLEELKKANIVREFHASPKVRQS